MKNNYLKHSLFLLLTFMCSMTYGQKSESLWTPTSKHSISQERLLPQGSTPVKALYYQLNLEGLMSKLHRAPETDSGSLSRTYIDFPNADGVLETYRVMEYSVMHPELQAKFPEIRSYVGHALKNPAQAIYFSVSPGKLHTMTLSNDRGTEFINPYSDEGAYEVFSRRDVPISQSYLACGLMDDGLSQEIERDRNLIASRNANDGTRRTYRLAVGTSVEYTNFHGGTVASAMAAINITMTRVNGIYDRELSMRMALVPNNDLLISTPGTSIFPNNESLSTLTGLFNTILGGSTNYDIGHTFTTGSGGSAYLGNVCGTNKGAGSTGLPNPSGDPFAIDYVSHEMGHQFGATHTFNGSAGNCGAGTRASSTAYEPGSGSTIMSYAGICSPQNVQINSSDYFHQASLQQIWDKITTVITCGTLTATGNAAPAAVAGASYTIPISTPYKLTGSSTDADGTNTHTYTWEQFDLGAMGMPTDITVTGPMVRSFQGTTSPVRYIPRLQDVIANGGNSTVWERLAAVDRVHNFVLTVRDNDPRGGQTAVDEMSVTTTTAAGPFMVTSQESNVTWEIGATKTVTWDVANTHLAPVNVSHVTIKLSTNGGVTFPYTLASEVPNSGIYEVVVPEVPETTSARIMVEAAGNIFYNVNSSNFEIAKVEYLLNFTDSSLSVCQPEDTAVFNFIYNTYDGYAQNTSFSVANLPTGTTATFNPASASVNGTPVTLTLSGWANATIGEYELTAMGTSGSLSIGSEVALSIFDSTIDAPMLTSPANGISGLYNEVSFTWERDPNVENYLIEISTQSDFSAIVDFQALTTSSYTSSLALETEYYWRVAGNNRCATGPWSAPRSFSTGISTCRAPLTATDTPIVIGALGTQTYTSVIPVTENLPVTGIKVKVDIKHSWVRDIELVLVSPMGTRVLLSSNNGNDFEQNYTNTFFDQDAAVSITNADAPFTGTFRPEEELSQMYGEMSAGNWTLEVKDLFDGDGGSIDEFSLELCLSSPLSVKEISFESFAVFPNPNHGEFTLKLQSSSGQDLQVAVYDMKGRKIFENRFKDPSNFREAIRLDNAPSGMYIITVSDGLKTVTKKILVD